MMNLANVIVMKDQVLEEETRKGNIAKNNISSKAKAVFLKTVSTLNRNIIRINIAHTARPQRHFLILHTSMANHLKLSCVFLTI